MKEGAIDILADMLTMFKKDDVVMRSVLRALYVIAKEGTGVEAHRMLELGCFEALDGVMTIHSQDREVKNEINRLTRVFLSQGGSVAVMDIKKRVMAIELLEKEQIIAKTHGEKYKHKVHLKSVDELSAAERRKQ